MSATTRSVLILAATLLVGAAVGAVTTGTVMNNRLDELESLRTRGGFSRVLWEVIDPADEERRDRVGEVLRASGARMSELRSECMGSFRAELETLRSALDPLLTAEETARLEAFLNRDRDGRKGGREHRRRRRPNGEASTPGPPPPQQQQQP